MTENSPTSGGIESEYDTASTNSRSDNERDEYEDSEEDSMDEEEATGLCNIALFRPRIFFKFRRFSFCLKILS